MTDFCASPDMMPFETALARLVENLPMVELIEEVPITDAVGRVVGQPVVSPVDVPPHNNSAMDGYAFSTTGISENLQFTLVGKSLAGAPYHGEVNAGQCIRITTGAKLPASCDAVVMQELVSVSNESISLTEKPTKHKHVRLKGEDIAKDQVVAQVGHLISAIDLGLFASLGIDKVAVYRKVKVALISTGDELKLPGQMLTEGDIYESNSFFLAAMLDKLNVEVIRYGVIPMISVR